ncbi:MAG: hypothetical protein WBG02_19135 [Candidatus Acidiferrum sp.]
MMNFLGRVMRFLFWLLVVSWSVALLRRLVGWMMRKAMPVGQANGAGPGTQTGSVGSELTPGRLVRDPVCGMHVAEELSIPLRDGEEMVRFCSAECRDTYVKSARRMAANG